VCYWVDGSRNAAHLTSFFFGEALGGWYYGLFPPVPTLMDQLTGIAIALAALASLSGLLTDPLQSHMRLHHRRLHRMLRRLEADVASIDGERSSYRPPDPYIARLLDAINAVRGPLL
jgi:hypothetical protein